MMQHAHSGSGTHATLTGEDAKKLSQLIARSWLPTEEGKAIKKIFNSGDTTQIVEVIKKYAGIDLKTLLGENLLVTVDWGSYLAEIEEVYLGGQDFRSVLRFPYPPPPPKDEVTQQELQDWVNNTDPNQIVAPFPYIPLSAGG